MLVLGVDMNVHVAMLDERDVDVIRVCVCPLCLLDSILEISLDVCTFYTLDHRVLLMRRRPLLKVPRRCRACLIPMNSRSVSEYLRAICSGCCGESLSLSFVFMHCLIVNSTIIFTCLIPS